VSQNRRYIEVIVLTECSDQSEEIAASIALRWVGKTTATLRQEWVSSGFKGDARKRAQSDLCGRHSLTRSHRRQRFNQASVMGNVVSRR
jgi:hypothetical protein